MIAHATNVLVDQLHFAGLNLSLAPAGGLAVGPSNHLTADLRDLIRSSKVQLVDWLMAANDASSLASNPSDDLGDWKKLAVVYYAHHFDCPTCIAAGRGHRYGNRCKTGLQLWHVYTEQLPAEVNPINDIHPSQLNEEEHYEE